MWRIVSQILWTIQYNKYTSVHEIKCELDVRKCKRVESLTTQLQNVTAKIRETSSIKSAKIMENMSGCLYCNCQRKVEWKQLHVWIFCSTVQWIKYSRESLVVRLIMTEKWGRSRTNYYKFGCFEVQHEPLDNIQRNSFTVVGRFASIRARHECMACRMQETDKTY